MSALYRYKITIEYDGTRFCGWQRQSHPLKGELITVQGALSIAVFKLTKQQVLVAVSYTHLTLPTNREV